LSPEVQIGVRKSEIDCQGFNGLYVNTGAGDSIDDVRAYASDALCGYLGVFVSGSVCMCTAAAAAAAAAAANRMNRDVLLAEHSGWTRLFAELQIYRV